MKLDDISPVLSNTMVKWQRIFVKSFVGVRVQVDPELKGNEHYVAVSKELYDHIKLMENNQCR